jgi:dihydrofolate reductase
LGRVTYEGFAAAWPSRTGEFADKMNGMPKYVVSATLKEAGWKNSTLIKSNIVEEISKLKDGPGGDILVAGSGRLVNTLMEHGLVDDLRLMVFPVILGKGKRLFTDGPTKLPLRLEQAISAGTGVLMLVYHKI